MFSILQKCTLNVLRRGQINVNPTTFFLRLSVLKLTLNVVYCWSILQKFDWFFRRLIQSRLIDVNLINRFFMVGCRLTLEV